jgi:hypothetical protein
MVADITKCTSEERILYLLTQLQQNRLGAPTVFFVNIWENVDMHNKPKSVTFWLQDDFMLVVSGSSETDSNNQKILFSASKIMVNYNNLQSYQADALK